MQSKAAVILLILFRCNELIGTADVASFYSPFRFSSQLLIDANVTDSQVQRLNVTIQRSLAVLSKLLTVIPIKESGWFLKRHNACAKFWTNGINENKCSMRSVGYDGERCLNVPSFKIPDEHLEGLEVYKSNVNLLSESIPPGKGLMNTDYMIYFRIISDASTSHCEGTFASSTVCQFGENDRPIAGLVTFCPRFMKNLFESRLSELLTIHELLHILAFSENLYSKYKDCQVLKEQLECYDRKNVVITDQNGERFLNLPTVKQKLKTVGHCGNLDCSQLKGGPLDKDSTSHWDETFLPYTLMVPKLIKANRTTLDAVSFAVLHDTGWYRVNFTLLTERNLNALVKEIEELYPYRELISSNNHALCRQPNIFFLVMLIITFNCKSRHFSLL